MKQGIDGEAAIPRAPVGGLAGWMLSRLRGRAGATPRLAVLERIALAPRQTLALVEADGRRFLVATSPDGTPSFQPLDAAHAHNAAGPRSPQEPRAPKHAGRAARLDRTAHPDREARVSW